MSHYDYMFRRLQAMGAYNRTTAHTTALINVHEAVSEFEAQGYAHPILQWAFVYRKTRIPKEMMERLCFELADEGLLEICNIRSTPSKNVFKPRLSGKKVKWA